jgi:hypothetical protein
MYEQWSDLLKSIPGAAKAVTELVGEAGNLGKATLSIGTAKAAQIAQAIRDETAVRSRMSNALTTAAETYILANPESLGQRAVEHGIRKIIQQEVNREAVMLKTLEYLHDDPPPEPTRNTPSDDWLNLFGSHAERATSETMREHWAQILKGEIRQPGSFSFATLQMAALLDHRLASTIQEMCRWIVDGIFIPTIERLNVGEPYSKLLMLDSIGFLRVGSGSRFYDFGPQGHLFLFLKNRTIIAMGPPGARVLFPAAMLTPAGQELLKIITYDSDPELDRLLLTFLQAHGANSVEVQPFSSS